MTTTKQCPFCAEDIHPEAKKCKHCHSVLDGEPVLIERTSKKHKGRMLLSFGIVVLGFAMGIFQSRAADELGALMVLFGALLFIVAILGAWWDHG